MIEKIKSYDYRKLFQSILKSLKKTGTRLQPIVVAVLIGLLAGIIMMLIFNPEMTWWGLGRLLKGGLTIGIKGLGDTLHHAAPIILTGLAVTFAFRTGLFNIGASGQMMIGAYVTVHIGVLWAMPTPLHWIVAITLGMLAGGIYALIPGLLKAFRNVNEVVSSIMLNYIAANLLVFLIGAYVLNTQNNGGSRNILPTAALPKLFESLFIRSSLNIGFVIAIVVAIITHIIIYKTTLGFQLRASGFSTEGSRYAGMSTKKNIIIAMFISGLFAGLAGAILFSQVGKTIPRVVEIFSEGFEGISVALLGLGEPIGAIFAGIFVSHLEQGGTYMQPHFKPEISQMITGVIIYVTAISAGLQIVLKKYKVQIKAFITKLKKKEVKTHDTHL
jgi:general nucleoside transport system permease protein